MGQTISTALGGSSGSNKRARDEDSNDQTPDSNASKKVKLDDDKEDGEISESEDTKPVNILQQRLNDLKWQSSQKQQAPQETLSQPISSDIQPQPQQASHSHSIRYPYDTALPKVPFTNYDVELVKNGLINGLSFDFLLQQGVDINLLNYSSSLIQSTPSTASASSQNTRKPPKKGVNLEIFNQNKQLFQRDPKTLTKAERKERKRIARLTKNKVKDEGDKRKNKKSNQPKASTSQSTADDFLNSLALSPHHSSATSASLVEPPSQTFNASQKPQNLKLHARSNKTPFLKSKASEIIITPSDDEEEVDRPESFGSSTRSIEKIPEWVVGRVAPVASTSTPTPPPMSLSQRAAQGDVKAQNELKRKENEIYEMQLKIKQMEIKREKQKLEAMMMGRMKGSGSGVQDNGVGSSSSSNNTPENAIKTSKVTPGTSKGVTTTTSTSTQIENVEQDEIVETTTTVEGVEGVEDVKYVVKEVTNDTTNDSSNSKDTQDDPDAQETSQIPSILQDGGNASLSLSIHNSLLTNTLHTGTTATTNNTEFESVFDKNPSLLQYVDDFDDDNLRSQLREQSDLFTDRRLCKYELPLGGKCKDRE